MKGKRGVTFSKSYWVIIAIIIIIIIAFILAISGIVGRVDGLEIFKGP